MSDLSDFGGGIERSTEEVTLNRGQKDDDEDGGSNITDQCKALTADDERCQNARSHMSDDPFCAPHSNSDNTEMIEEEDD